MEISHQDLTLLVGIIVLLVMSLLIVSLQCWVGIAIEGFGLDDMLMLFGQA